MVLKLINVNEFPGVMKCIFDSLRIVQLQYQQKLYQKIKR